MEIEKVLYSLIPLILIIVFSWLFSFLGQRARGNEEDQQSQTLQQMTDPFGMLTEEDDEAEELPRTRYEDHVVGVRHEDSAHWTPQFGEHDRIGSSADPIKPKWWGA